MKKNSFYIFLLFVLLGCNNPKKQSETLIKQYLKEHLNDFSSYEPVKFDKLDSAFTSVMETKDWEVYDKKYLEFEEKAEKVNEKVQSIVDNMGFHSLYTYQEDKLKLEYLKEKGSQYTDSMRFYNGKMQLLYDNFRKEFKGWSLNHTYRANNALGNKVIVNTIFIFDKDVKKIIEVKNIE